jgi:hypothetical protein
MVQSSQRIQQFETPYNSFGWRFIKEIEVQDIIDPQGFQHEHYHSEIGTLDFRDGILKQLVFERPFGVKSEGFTRTDSTSSSGSLLSGCTGDGLDNE